MVNEDIITSLKNAIEGGESLDTAISIAINSGYNSREVEEAAKFVGEGVIQVERLSQEQILAMPNKRGLFSNIFSSRKIKTYNPPKLEPTSQNATQASKSLKPPPQYFQQVKPAPLQQTSNFYSQSTQSIQPQRINFPQIAQLIKPQPIQQLPKEQTAEDIKENIDIPRPQISEIQKPKPAPRQSYAKEIILLILLLILIGILIITFKFRDQIIAFFSSI